MDQTRVVYDSEDDYIKTKVNIKQQKSVVLTFDDGPSKVLTNILDVLKKEDVPAVFFWQSRLLYPDRPWKRVLKEGHTIGTHSCKHLNLVNLTYDQQLEDIKRSTKKIEQITGEKVRFFRPPFGQFNSDTIKVADELGLSIVMWRIAAMDWELKDNPEQIISYVVDNLEDGAIILLHELTQTHSILPQLINRIREEGYTFATLYD